MEDADNRLRISQRARARATLLRHGWNYKKKCRVLQFARKCLVNVPQFPALPYGALCHFERMHTFFIAYCDYLMDLLVSLVRPNMRSKVGKTCIHVSKPVFDIIQNQDLCFQNPDLRFETCTWFFKTDIVFFEKRMCFLKPAFVFLKTLICLLKPVFVCFETVVAIYRFMSTCTLVIIFGTRSPVWRTRACMNCYTTFISPRRKEYAQFFIGLMCWVPTQR